MRPTIHAAAKRAAYQILDARLERIGPLLNELYRRLRPHPVWSDIDYMVRGDIRRFLRLDVGEGLNPQFLFSSGQRRVTGLAFLLSVYLSTSWSCSRSVILDDPVQHIDDFGAVHLRRGASAVTGARSPSDLRGRRFSACRFDLPSTFDVFSIRRRPYYIRGGRRRQLWYAEYQKSPSPRTIGLAPPSELSLQS